MRLSHHYENGGAVHPCYAQRAEDAVLLQAFDGQRDGFYVDVGAGHPVIGSVTKVLADGLGWRGVNIEPQQEWFAQLCQARPRDVNICVAIGNAPDAAVLYRLPDDPAQTTIDFDNAERQRRLGWRIEERAVPVLPLEIILARFAFPGFDVLKIDVEGKEADVVQSLDLDRWRPRAVVIEAVMPRVNRPSHDQWEHLILSAGYALAHFDGLNRFYALRTDHRLFRRLERVGRMISTNRSRPASSAPADREEDGRRERNGLRSVEGGPGGSASAAARLVEPHPRHLEPR